MFWLVLLKTSFLSRERWSYSGAKSKKIHSLFQTARKARTWDSGVNVYPYKALGHPIYSPFDLLRLERETLSENLDYQL